MSYARFGAASDVYVYLDVAGYLRCCACRMHDRPFGSFDFRTTAEMLTHLDLHRSVGDTVPERTFEGLRRDAAETDAWIAAGVFDDQSGTP